MCRSEQSNKIENCTICGGEIPRSLLRWAASKTGTPDEIWSKGYFAANFNNIRKDIRSNITLDHEYVNRLLQTRLYLWPFETNPRYPICWRCAGKAKRKCFSCEKIFTGKLQFHSEPWEFIVAYNELSWNYGWGNYGDHWLFCGSARCLDSEAFLHGMYKYPGYRKAIQHALSLFRSGDTQGAMVFVASQLMEYEIHQRKRGRA